MRELFIKAEHERSAHRCRTSIVFEGLSRFEPDRIVYEIIGPDAPQQEPNGNFAVAAALPTAMSLGRPLHVRGEVDADFLATMEEYMAAWCRWRPDLFQPVAISADVETVPARIAARQAPSWRSRAGSIPPLRCTRTSMRCLAGGSWISRRPSSCRASISRSTMPMRSTSRAGTSKAILDSYGVRLNVVRTNWQKPFSVKWTMTHALGIAAVLHLFHRQFGNGVLR